MMKGEMAGWGASTYTSPRGLKSKMRLGVSAARWTRADFAIQPIRFSCSVSCHPTLRRTREIRAG